MTGITDRATANKEISFHIEVLLYVFPHAAILIET